MLFVFTRMATRALIINENPCIKGDLVIPNSVVDIEAFAFKGCTGFTGMFKYIYDWHYVLNPFIILFYFYMQVP